MEHSTEYIVRKRHSSMSENVVFLWDIFTTFLGNFLLNAWVFYYWYIRTYWPDCLRWIIFREQQDPFYVLHLPKTSLNVPGILQLVQNWNETNNLRLIFLIRFKGVYTQLPNIYDAIFCKNSKRFLEAVNNFSKKAPSSMFDTVLNKPLHFRSLLGYIWVLLSILQ